MRLFDKKIVVKIIDFDVNDDGSVKEKSDNDQNNWFSECIQRADGISAGGDNGDVDMNFDALLH